jgi:HAD superfamily hydrolase (TIGR01509 family)
MANIQAVLFDMDGVLCDSEPFICEAAIQMFKDVYNQEVQEEDFLPFVGTGEDRYLGGVAEQYGIQLEMPADKVTTYETYLEIIKGRLPPLPGVLSFIKAARVAGLRLAVNSAADRMKVEGNLREIGVTADQFDAVVTGSDITHKKPHPEGYLRAAKLIGIDPAQCLVVEDAINGIEAGCAAGAVCLGLSTSFSADKLKAAGARFTGAHLDDVPADLLSLLGIPA